MQSKIGHDHQATLTKCDYNHIKVKHFTKEIKCILTLTVYFLFDLFNLS